LSQGCHSFVHLSVLIVFYMTGENTFSGNTVNVTLQRHDTGMKSCCTPEYCGCYVP